MQTNKTKKIRGKHSMVLSTKITDRSLLPVMKLKLGDEYKGSRHCSLYFYVYLKLSVLKHFKEETHIIQNANICNIFLLDCVFIFDDYRETNIKRRASV